MEPGKNVVMKVERRDGGALEASLRHSFSRGQLKWLRAGSALNWIKQSAGAAGGIGRAMY